MDENKIVVANKVFIIQEQLRDWSWFSPAYKVEGIEHKLFVLQEIREIEEWQKIINLFHPNLLYLLEIIPAAGEAQKNYLLWEYFESKTLNKLLEEEAVFGDFHQIAWIGLQIAKALAALEGQKLAHQNLLPENILIGDENLVKLKEFFVPQENIMEQYLKHPECWKYIPPEQIEKGQLGAIDTAGNVFTLGALLYELVSNREYTKRFSHIEQLLAEGRDPFSIVRSYCDLLTNFNFPSKTPKGLVIIILNTLTPDRDTRLALSSIINILETILEKPYKELSSATPIPATAVSIPEEKEEEIKTLSSSKIKRQSHPPQKEDSLQVSFGEIFSKITHFSPINDREKLINFLKKLLLVVEVEEQAEKPLPGVEESFPSEELSASIPGFTEEEEKSELSFVQPATTTTTFPISVSTAVPEEIKTFTVPPELVSDIVNQIKEELLQLKHYWQREFEEITKFLQKSLEQICQKFSKPPPPVFEPSTSITEEAGDGREQKRELLEVATSIIKISRLLKENLQFSGEIFTFQEKEFAKLLSTEKTDLTRIKLALEELSQNLQRLKGEIFLKLYSPSSKPFPEIFTLLLAELKEKYEAIAEALLQGIIPIPIEKSYWQFISACEQLLQHYPGAKRVQMKFLQAYIERFKYIGKLTDFWKELENTSPAGLRNFFLKQLDFIIKELNCRKEFQERVSLKGDRLVSESEDVSNFYRKKLLDLLNKKYNFTQIPIQPKVTFIDPELHQLKEKIITNNLALNYRVEQVYSPGYCLGDKVIKKAEVSYYFFKQQN